jgi:hypothetical protein
LFLTFGTLISDYQNVKNNNLMMYLTKHRRFESSEKQFNLTKQTTGTVPVLWFKNPVRGFLEQNKLIFAFFKK